MLPRFSGNGERMNERRMGGPERVEATAEETKASKTRLISVTDTSATASWETPSLPGPNLMMIGRQSAVCLSRVTPSIPLDVAEMTEIATLLYDMRCNIQLIYFVFDTFAAPSFTSAP